MEPTSLVSTLVPPDHPLLGSSQALPKGPLGEEDRWSGFCFLNKIDMLYCQDITGLF